MTLLLACCSYTTLEDGDTSFTYYDTISNMEVYLDKSFTAKEVKDVIGQTRNQAKAFQSDWNTQIKPIDTFIINSETLPCGDRVGNFVGCFRLSTPSIRVVYRKKILHALYHECVHWMLPTHDFEHEDKRWRTTWTPRQAEFYRKTK